MKNIRIFVSENFQVFGGESFYILNRRVFVMIWAPISCSKATLYCPILRDNSCKSYTGPVKITVLVLVLAADCQLSYLKIYGHFNSVVDDDDDLVFMSFLTLFK